MKSLSRKDFWASISLLFVAIPICAGIAVASKTNPANGILAALIAGLIFGFFSSSPMTVVGPSASLSIFLSMASLKLAGEAGIAHAIILCGLFLVLLSFLNVYRWVNLVPRSVMRGMATGVGLILVMKMMPHLLGYDGISLLESDQFTQSDGRNTITELIYGWQNFLPGSLIISLISMFLFLVLSSIAKKSEKMSKIPTTLLVVGAGVILNQIFHYVAPSWALSEAHMLGVDSLKIHFRSLDVHNVNWKAVIELALSLTAVIVLEGLITLDIFQKIDPTHSRVRARKELRLLGVTNALMGIAGLLPVMPVLIRSKAAVDLGGRSRWTIILMSVWMILALYFYHYLKFIPMASVAAILAVVGLNLISFKDIKFMIKNGKDHWVPFFVTVIFIFFVDLLWGIAIGFIIGLMFSLKSITRRTMVLVHDDERYLLKFHKDVTFLNKSELRHLLGKVPINGEVIIDGTGNIFIDAEIEEWLEDWSQEATYSGITVSFLKSRLAVSRLFKEI